MTLFERIHEVIKARLDHHADEFKPVDTEALTSDVIEAHAAHVAENPIPQTPDDVAPEADAQKAESEEKPA